MHFKIHIIPYGLAKGSEGVHLEGFPPFKFFEKETLQVKTLRVETLWAETLCAETLQVESLQEETPQVETLWMETPGNFC